ncbi:MAG: 2-C-methyl-D-erythritol 2,4-cyclodiphosphate synthase [candidate division Zixibacteria bacterium SM23_73_3]|nr:MAG: 2-C-methyl-D-erythritol 2,4-cyclodiphosphate synthase [candidate division Zixibacteria bacterium SM23_73_3]
MFRIGFGYDAHRLTKGRDLILGGVKIPHEKGLLGHSDADVLSHAIGEAILGALSLGDLGKHFPDSDQKYKDISSLKILSMINDMAKRENAKIINIDSTIVAEEPKLSGHIPKMRENISDVLNIDINQVSVKATTTEKMGFVGKKEGIAAYAVVLTKRERP